MSALADGKVVKSERFREMITPATVTTGKAPRYPYGFGLYVWKVRGELMVGHTGQIAGFASIAAYIPSKDIIVIALANDNTFNAQMFGRRLAAIAIGNAYPKVKDVPFSSVDLAEIPGDYQDGAEVRTIFARDGKLFSQRPGRTPNQLQITSNGHLHFVPDELTYLVPVKDSSGKVTRLDYFENGDGPERPLNRLSKPSP